MYQVPLDGRVIALTLSVSLTCGLLAGLVPAFLRLGAGAASVTAAGGRSVTGNQWLRAGFASLQLALSLALVVGSLLLATTLRRLHSVDLGFEPAGVTRHSVDPQRHGYAGDRALVYYQDLASRLDARSGIDAVSVAGRSPFGSSWRVRIQDPAGADRPPIQVLSNNVDGSYFETLRMPIVRGRAFTAAEGMTPLGAVSLPVIVSESLARRIFGSVEPVGGTFMLPAGGNAPKREATVVGVVGDVHWNDLTDEKPMLLYQPYPQFPSGGTLLVRSRLPPAETSRIVDDVAREIDASLPVSFSVTLASLVDSETSDQRTFAWVLSLVGWIAFLLAAVGLYGLLAQSVAERTREFGIRLAIGSGRAHVFRLVLKQAAWIGAIGTVGGLTLAYFGTRMIETQLHGVTRVDLPTYALATVALVVVVLTAGLWPARMATRIQPVDALRAE
jgi:predicted permease